MINFNFFENLIDFFDELFELLKQDWKKFKLFVKENKKKLLWIFIALITLQFTSLIHVGNSCNKYYKVENNKLQRGGSAASFDQAAKAAHAAAQGAAGAAPAAGAAGAAPAAAAPKSRREIAKQRVLEKQAKKKAMKKDSESKNVQKNLDLFNKLKGEKDKLSKDGLAGPIFGNIDSIFEKLGAIFSLFAVILTILGILSLPILIFIVITYCIIKKVLTHLALV